MIEFITRFVQYIKDFFGYALGLPSLLGGLIVKFSSFLDCIYPGCGVFISGFLIVILSLAIVVAIVRVVTNIL